jgi:hypothetical protein
VQKFRYKGKEVTGTITYPNYNEATEGYFDLQWVFTPDSDIYETKSGIIRFKLYKWADDSQSNKTENTQTDETIEAVTGAALTATTLTLAPETTYDININNKPIYSGIIYKWTSKDTNVAIVNENNGLVSSVSDGSTVVKCDIITPDGNINTLTTDVIVNPIDENLSCLSDTELNLEVGDIYKIDVENKVSGSKVKFKSSNKTIIKVYSSGKIKALSAGECIITCTISNGTNVSVLKCNITVE